jgi:hypothetical protein
MTERNPSRIMGGKKMPWWVDPRCQPERSGKRGNTGARGNGPVAGSAQAVKRGAAHARGSKWAVGKDWAAGPKARKRSKFLFFFLFNYFKVFSNDFESYFEFESNHSNQKFKYNSMSAQTCIYPYI